MTKHPKERRILIKDDEGPVVIPDSVKKHFATRAGGLRYNPMLDPEIAPLSMTYSKTTGAVALRTKILIGRIIKCRVQGMSYSAIAKNLGINENDARRHAEHGIRKAFPEEEVETLRAITLAQYDEVIQQYWHEAIEMGEESAAKILMHAMAEKRKMLALDKQPVKKSESTQNINVTLESQAQAILERYDGDFIDVEGVEEEPKALGPGLEMDETLMGLLHAEEEPVLIEEEADESDAGV